MQNQKAKAPTREFVLGIDVGTSSTKAVIQDLTTNDAWAVPIGSLCGFPRSPYIAPTAISLTRAGYVKVTDDEKAIRNLKLRLLLPGKLETKTNGDPLVYLTAYLALIIQSTMDWFETEHAAEIGGHDLRWELNVGMPAKSIDDEQMSRAYEKMIRAAWFAQLSGQKVSLGACKSALQKLQRPSKAQLEAVAVNVLPEVVAQMIGYARSARRRDGLHLMIDVGAGTLDALMFKIDRKDDEDQFYVYETDVQPLGAYVLHMHRLDALAANGVRAKKDAYVANSWSAIFPDEIEEYVWRHDDLDEPTKRYIQSIDRSFEDECFREIKRVIDRTKSHRYRKAPEWKSTSQLRTFLCGGGARNGFYEKLFTRLKKNANQRGTKLAKTKLPKPQRFHADKLDPNDLDRLSVAYGLSFTALDLGDVQLPSKIKDDVEDAKNSKIDDMVRRAIEGGYER